MISMISKYMYSRYRIVNGFVQEKIHHNVRD